MNVLSWRGGITLIIAMESSELFTVFTFLCDPSIMRDSLQFHVETVYVLV